MCGGFGAPIVESERESLQGKEDAGVVRIRALRTVLIMLGHGVRQARDAGDESSCSLKSENQ